MIRVNPLEKKKKKSNHFCINGTSQVVSCFLLLSYSETACVKLCNTRRSNELKICFWNRLARSMPMQGFCHYCGKLCQRLFQLSIHISKKVHLYSSVVAKNRIVDVIYQAWEAVFHHQMKCWEESWKYDVQQSIFDKLQGVSSDDETLCWMLDMTSQTKWF